MVACGSSQPKRAHTHVLTSCDASSLRTWLLATVANKLLLSASIVLNTRWRAVCAWCSCGSTQSQVQALLCMKPRTAARAFTIVFRRSLLSVSAGDGAAAIAGTGVVALTACACLCADQRAVYCNTRRSAVAAVHAQIAVWRHGPTRRAGEWASLECTTRGQRLRLRLRERERERRSLRLLLSFLSPSRCRFLRSWPRSWRAPVSVRRGRQRARNAAAHLVAVALADLFVSSLAVAPAKTTKFDDDW